MTAAQDLGFLSDNTKMYAENVSRDIANRQNDPRSMCFWNIHNRVKIAEEIMNFYEKSWNSDEFPDIDDDMEGELVERVITVTRDLFVDVVSAIEKAVKDSVGIYKNSGVKERSLEKGSHLYLRNIIEACFEMNLINRSTFTEWDDILVMRNLAAHNNSISDRSKKYEIGDITIAMRPGRMMKGPLNTFIVLTNRVITLFFSWLEMMDQRF